MRAVQVSEPGGPEVLSVTNVDLAEPKPGDLIIETAAAGVNFIDTYQRGGLYPMEFPFVPGLECAGTVSAIGDGVTEFAVGDRVAVANGNGGYAEARAAIAEFCVAVPDDVPLDLAAASLLQGMTAQYLAVDTYPLRAGDRCLIHAGAGGTGRILIQMAKQAGAEVFTTVGTDAKGELAASAGADHVINYNDHDFAEVIREIAGIERPLDVVYDGVGASVFEASLGLIRKRGLMATFGNASGPVPPVSPLDLMTGGSLFLTRPTLFDYIDTRDDLVRRASDVFNHIAAGSLDIRIGGRYTLEDAGQAHIDLEGRKTTGKLLIIP
jgi:NADPH2:quinone reductase